MGNPTKAHPLWPGSAQTCLKGQGLRDLGTFNTPRLLWPPGLLVRQACLEGPGLCDLETFRPWGFCDLEAFLACWCSDVPWGSIRPEPMLVHRQWHVLCTEARLQPCSTMLKRMIARAHSSMLSPRTCAHACARAFSINLQNDVKLLWRSAN